MARDWRSRFKRSAKKTPACVGVFLWVYGRLSRSLTQQSSKRSSVAGSTDAGSLTHLQDIGDIYLNADSATAAAYDLGILTSVGGHGYNGANDTCVRIAQIDVTGVTQAQVAAAIDFIA